MGGDMPPPLDRHWGYDVCEFAERLASRIARSVGEIADMPAAGRLESRMSGPPARNCMRFQPSLWRNSTRRKQMFPVELLKCYQDLNYPATFSQRL